MDRNYGMFQGGLTLGPQIFGNRAANDEANLALRSA